MSLSRRTPHLSLSEQLINLSVSFADSSPIRGAIADGAPQGTLHILQHVFAGRVGFAGDVPLVFSCGFFQALAEVGYDGKFGAEVAAVGDDDAWRMASWASWYLTSPVR